MMENIECEATSAHTSEPQAPVDFVLVTALEEERDAVLSKLPEHRKLPPSANDVRVYFACDLPVTFADGSTAAYRVIIVPLLSMGRVDAANATGDAIRRWRPRRVLLVGIAGGISGAGAALGDILVSDQVVDYELQKMSPEGAEVRYSVHRADPSLVGAAQNYVGEGWPDLLQVKRPRKGKPKRLVGPIATGDKVIAFQDILNRYRSDWPKLVGVEMEAGGVASACFQAAEPPGFFMVRSVSDMADDQKESVAVKKWRPYACDAAAAYTIGLLQSGPVLPILKHAPPNPQ
jgi:nucleoside phosphorylase